MGKHSILPTEQMTKVTDEEIAAFKQRWSWATKGSKIRPEMIKRIEERERITNKEKKSQEKEKQEQMKRKREERTSEQEERKKMKGGGQEEETKEIQEKTTTPLKNQGGSRDLVPRGGSEGEPHVPTNTTLHYTTLHYTTLHYTG